MAVNPYASRQPASSGSQGLADVLERVLDKGLVIAGDIQVNLLDIELLTIKIRLLIASADTAQQMGIDWWQHDPFLTQRRAELDGYAEGDRDQLLERLDRLERLVQGQLADGRELADPEEGPQTGPQDER